MTAPITPPLSPKLIYIRTLLLGRHPSQELLQAAQFCFLADIPVKKAKQYISTYIHNTSLANALTTSNPTDKTSPGS